MRVTSRGLEELETWSRWLRKNATKKVEESRLVAGGAVTPPPRPRPTGARRRDTRCGKITDCIRGLTCTQTASAD